LADKIDFNFLINQFEIYPFLLYIAKTFTFFPDSHLLMIALSSITYGLFSISIYLFLQELNVKLDWLMTIFILFQIPALRTTWALQKDILALSFTFIIFYVVLKNRKSILVIILPQKKYYLFWFDYFISYFNSYNRYYDLLFTNSIIIYLFYY
jgi:hypothetical protein